MSSAVSALIPQLANYNPQGFAQQNQLRQQQMGMNALEAQHIQQQNALTQQQTAGLAQEQAIKQQQLSDAQVIRDAYMKTDGDPNNLKSYMLKNGISGTGLMGWQQHAYDLLSKAQTYDTQRIANEEKLHNLAGNVVDSLNQIKDDGEMQRSYQQQLQTLQREAPDVPWKPQITRDDLNFYSGVLGHANTVLAQAKERQATATAAAQEREATAKAAHQEIVNKLIDTGNQATKNGQHPIDAILAAGATDPSLTGMLQGFRASYDALGQTPPDENGRRPAQDATVEAAARAAAQYREKLSPQLRQAEVQRAVETKQATAPIETATAVNTEAAKLRLQQSLSTDIFAGVASPQDRAKATSEYQNYSSKFIDSMEASQGLRDLIDQAQRGNKAAPGLIGIAELRTYLNRVTTPELRSVTGAGNLVDKVEGFLKGATEGQPIPPDILQATDQIAQMQQQQAQRKYGNQLGLLGTTYNKGQAPPAFQWQPHGGQQAAQPAGGMPRVATPADVAKLPKGTHFLDPNGVERIVR